MGGWSYGKKPAGHYFREWGVSFLFVVPALLIFGIFYVYPFIDILKLSFQSWDGIGPRHWVLFENYRDLIGNREWWRSVWNAGFITFVALTFQNAFAFALALACDREIRLKGFYRVIFFLPPILSEIVVGLLWRLLLAPAEQGGVLNAFLSKLGLYHLVNDWLSDPETALSCIAIVHSWKGFGWGFILLLVGLQTIDRQYYEAALVDGAGVWQRFVNVTLPMMVPVIAVVMILTILGSMQSFVLVLSMTPGELGGYTDVPVLQILTSMTDFKEFGTACAMGVIFAGILITLSVFFKMMSNRMKQL